MVYTKYTFFHGYFFKIGKKKTSNWRFSKLKCNKTCNWCTCNWCICTHFTNEKTCIWCTPSICCEIRKIGQRQIGVKIISVFKLNLLINQMILITEIWSRDAHVNLLQRMLQTRTMFVRDFSRKVDFSCYVL